MFNCKTANLADILNNMVRLDTHSQTRLADMIKRAVAVEIARTGAAPMRAVDHIDFNRVIETICADYNLGKGK